MRTFTLAAAAASSFLASSVHAAVYCTQPVSSTSWEANTVQQVQWIDDGDKPAFDEIKGNIQVDLYTGTTTQQTFLITLAVVDPNDGTVNVLIEPSVGPDSDDYFLRFRPDGSDDLTNDTYSARFSMTGMTGSWPDAVLAANSAADSSATAAASTSTEAAGGVAALTIASKSQAAPSGQASRIAANSDTTTGAGSKLSASTFASVLLGAIVTAYTLS